MAAELEKRWEAALNTLKQAEAASAQQASQPMRLVPLPAEVQERFQAVGQHLPLLWQDGVIGQVHKKALLRALIDKVVVQRVGRDQVQARLVWKGGETTTLHVPVSVGAWADLTGAARVEQIIVEQSTQGVSDEEIATYLTEQGYRSPQRREMLPNTVKIVRLRHRIFHTRHQSHPRRVAGYLTVPQITEALGLTPHWIYDRIHNGTIAVAKDPQRKAFLFPDSPATLDRFRQLKDGTLTTLVYGREHQDA